MNIKNSLTKCGTVLALTLLFGQTGLAPMSVVAQETQGTTNSIKEEAETTTTESQQTETQEQTNPVAGNLSLDTPNLALNQTSNASAYTTDGGSIIYNSTFGKLTRDIANSTGQLSKDYGSGAYIQTPYIQVVDGEDSGTAWCIIPDAGFPVNLEYAKQVYSDLGIYNILYYSMENGWDQANSNYVDVFVALNAYLGHTIGGVNLNSSVFTSSPNVSYLLQKAKDKDAPTGNFDIKNKIQTADFSKDTKQQFTDWYTPETTGSGVTYTIPTNSFDKEVTVELSDGTKISGQSGNYTANANVKFRLLAPANYEKTIDFTITTNQRKKSALIFKPTAGNAQDIVKMGGMKDPIKVPEVKATFFKRMGQLQIGKQDAVTGNMVPNTVYSGTIGDEAITFTTDGLGMAPISNEYVDGTEYNFVEMSVPTGYVLDKTPITGTIVAGEVTKIIQKNDIQKAGNTLEKEEEVYNAEESTKQGKPIYEWKPAAELSFTQKSITDVTAPDEKTVIEKAGEYTDTQVTNAEGSITFKPFYNGAQNKYELTENTQRDNYRPMEPIKFSVPWGESSVSVVGHRQKVKNYLKKGLLIFNKKNQIDPSNPLNLAGAKFHFYGQANSNTADVDLTFDTTTESTKMELKDGVYYANEIKYPNGFTQPDGQSETMMIVIEDGKTTTVDWDNKPITPLTPTTPKTTTVAPVSTKTTGTLPHTGEKSNSWIVALGAMTIVSAAVACVFYKKPKNAA